jgi:hypothetical protein
MLTLSAKAKIFVEEALSDPRTCWLRWNAIALGADPWSKPLSFQAARVASDALSETEKRIRDRLGDPETGIDEQAELVNDLGFIRAVQRDLQRELRAAP